ncbi:MAG: hypothetical protein ABIS50_04170 [Luteolibacter sp.]|uniref:hypothetical protein n=1 Tax=Luteolibacter sp. TaxID=1962973 RepID=UPI0032666AA3
MTKDQINSANMLQTTLLILTLPGNAAIYSALPAFVRGVTALEGSINVLGTLAQAQGSPLTGIALDKERLQRSLITRLLIVSGAAGAYSYEAGNHTLAAKFDFKEGALKNLRDSLLDEIAQGVHDQAAAIVAAHAVKAADYNLTPAMLTDLQSAITAYGSTLGTPRAAIANRTAITAAIAAELDRATDSLKNVLDRLIVQFAADHPAFTTAYAAARKVISTGTTSKPAATVPPIS